MVVDIGIHVMGWSYARARACFTENTALADINIDTELDRYIGAPGGAVAYKVGELKIIELRRRAEAIAHACAWVSERGAEAVRLLGADDRGAGASLSHGWKPLGPAGG